MWTRWGHPFSTYALTLYLTESIRPRTQRGGRSFYFIFLEIIISISSSKPNTNEKRTGGGGGSALRCRQAALRELFICNGLADDDADDDFEKK